VANSRCLACATVAVLTAIAQEHTVVRGASTDPMSQQSCNTDCQEAQTECALRCDQDEPCIRKCGDAAVECSRRCHTQTGAGSTTAIPNAHQRLYPIAEQRNHPCSLRSALRRDYCRSANLRRAPDHRCSAFIDRAHRWSRYSAAPLRALAKERSYDQLGTRLPRAT
jgi:hypothetical protein